MNEDGAETQCALNVLVPVHEVRWFQGLHFSSCHLRSTKTLLLKILHASLPAALKCSNFCLLRFHYIQRNQEKSLVLFHFFALLKVKTLAGKITIPEKYCWLDT